MSDDTCMYELIEELKAQVKALTKELMLAEAECEELRDELCLARCYAC